MNLEETARLFLDCHIKLIAIKVKSIRIIEFLSNHCIKIYPG